MLQKKIRLGDLLVSEGLVTEEQVNKAFELQKLSQGQKRLGQILIEEDYIEEEAMLRILAKQLGVEYIVPGSFEADFVTAEKVKIATLRSSKAIPIRETEDSFLVLFSDPLDFTAQDLVQRLLPSKPIKVAITKDSEVRILLDRLESLEGLKEIISDVRREINSAANVLKKLDANESAIMRLIDLILESAIVRKASDIHIEPSDINCSVRARIDGFLTQLFVFDSDIYPPLASRVKLLGELDIAERRKPQDGRFSKIVQNKEFDFRLSTLPISKGESIVMRILDKSRALIKLDEIGFKETNAAKFRKAMKQPYGIIFVTGPTGSGKTTSLYAGLNEIKNISTKIITVEDPVEYQMDLIQQVQVQEKAGLTFATALRSILRQDPDIIMIGESRDLQTISIAVQAALTGHLVFTTLHTNDAVSAITRIVDMGVEPVLVANSIVAIQAQRLVRKVCKYCTKPAKIPPEYLEKFKDLLPENYHFVTGVGCKRCGNSGYMGRTIISEVFEVNPKISEVILKGGTKKELFDAGVETGFEPMFNDGFEKAARGITTLEEIMRVAKLEE